MRILCFLFILFVGPIYPVLADEPLFLEAKTLVISQDSEGLARLLAAGKIKVNRSGDDGARLLHIAASVGDVGLARMLIENGASINAIETVNGWTPLMISIYYGNRELVSYLLTLNPNLVTLGKDKSTAYSLARFSSMEDLVYRPQSKFKKLSERELKSRLFKAQQAGDEELVRELQGAIRGQTPELSSSQQRKLDKLLLKAAEAGDARLVSELLSKNADPSYRSSAGWSALHYAAARVDTSLFKLLANKSPRALSENYQGNALKIPLSVAVLVGGHVDLSIPSSRILEFFDVMVSMGVDLDRQFGKKANHELAGEFGYRGVVQNRFTHPPFEIEMPAIRLKQRMSKSDWKEVQRTLKRLGLYKASIDGISGSGTKRAVYAYFVPFFENFNKQVVQSCAVARSSATTGVNFSNKGNRAGGVKWTSDGRSFYRHGYRCTKTNKSQKDAYYLYFNDRLIVSQHWNDKTHIEQRSIYDENSKLAFIVDLRREWRNYGGLPFAKNGAYTKWGDAL